MADTAVASKSNTFPDVKSRIDEISVFFAFLSFILEKMVFFISSVPSGKTRFTWAKQDLLEKIE